MAELEALGRVHRHHLHADGPVARHRLLLAQPRLGHGGDRAGELARGGLRRAAHVGGGELGELGEVHEPLDDLHRRREQQLAPQPEALDQAVDVEVRARGVERRRGRAVELEERADALARLGRDLRRLERGAERGDHVELAPARDLRAAGDVDRAQLDGRPRERAHDRAGVARIDEQPQPGEQVAHLGALEERRRAREPVRHRALLERDGDRLALVADRAHEHADVLGRHLLARDEPLDLGGHGLGLRALALAAPERDLAAVAAAQLLGDAVRDRLGDRAGGGEDALGAAVALLEPHHRRRGPLGLEVAQVLRRRAAEPVDRLVVVAGGADLPVLAREQPHQQALGEVRVLQLVDEHVAVARGHPRAHVRLRAQDAEGVAAAGRRSRASPPPRACGRGPRRWRRTRARGRPRGRASPPTPRSPRARRARP